MGETLRMGRIAGIRVGANWSLLVAAWLIVWAVARGFYADYPGHEEGTYLVAAAVAVVILYGTLLAHELGHAVTARRQGIPVDGITLWLFGGVTRTRGEPATPRRALGVALVGPLVSFAAAGLFAVVAAAFDGVGMPEIVEGMARWLARTSVLLAAFNLVPAAPLDGGRVLQAELWRRWDDRRAASATAAQAGRGFGFLLVGLGLLDVFTGVGVGGLWFVFLGWFLGIAATNEDATTEARMRLHGIRAAEVMRADPVVVPAWISVDAFLDDYVRRHRLAAYPVEGFRGELEGLVTLDAVNDVAPDRRGAVRVADVAIPAQHVAVARSEEMVLDLLERMGARAAGHAVVVHDGRAVGTISANDVARELDAAAALDVSNRRESLAPTGSAIASAEPKATIRMTIAEATPRISRLDLPSSSSR